MTYRTSARPDSQPDAHCATVVGDGRRHPENVAMNLLVSDNQK